MTYIYLYQHAICTPLHAAYACFTYYLWLTKVTLAKGTYNLCTIVHFQQRTQSVICTCEDVHAVYQKLRP